VKVVTEIDTFFFMQGCWISKRAYGNFEMWKRSQGVLLIGNKMESNDYKLYFF